ncbi:MAG TPA: 8-amino-7-oxononanoate synthase [Polyangiaceae bacterium]|nr:8-amino-7-oxononanoate synthase [Polyangiaceae bacterium]
MQDWLRERLAELEAAGLLRDPADADVRQQLSESAGAEPRDPRDSRAGLRPRLLDACSNDYLGLAAAPVSRETFEELGSLRIGAGASRLVQGTFPEQLVLEQELASWTRCEAVLLTSSAFAANLGALPALCDSHSVIISDALNHASIVDACRLARCQVVVTPHLDLTAIEAALRKRSPVARAWVVLETLFSMDGDCPDLPAVRALCDRYGAGLLLDEAHSLGTLGPEGAGLAAAQGVRAEVLVGGLGKAVGAQGGFLAGSGELRTWLWNRARSFVFSTAPSPLLSHVVLAQVRRARRADAARERLSALSRELRQALQARGIPLAIDGIGPIVPVRLGSNDRAMRAMAVLRERAILAQAIRPPTVPVGAARLRLTVHADWPDDAVSRLAEGVEAACAS